MVVRVTASVIALLAIITFGIFFTLYVNNFCSDLIRETTSTAESMDIKSLYVIKHRWETKVPLLSSLIPHEHVDAVTDSLDRAISFLNNDDISEFTAEINSTINQLSILAKYDTPTLRTLF